jgi:putative DNA primase/helicase
VSFAAPGVPTKESARVVAETESPKALKVLPEAIPDELKARPQWVCWRYAMGSKNRWTKHPYNPCTGRKASSTDLLTWSSFDEVFEAYVAGDYDGVGFVFCSGDPYTGVDLDGCRDPKSGEVKPWAVEIVSSLGGYTELSPSGQGLHIVVKGKAPKALKLPYIEMYSIERFFTMTGHPTAVLGVAA